MNTMGSYTIQNAIRTVNCVTQSTSEVSGGVYKGTEYTDGHVVVVVEHNTCGYISVKITLILISPTNVYFVIELQESVLDLSLTLEFTLCTTLIQSMCVNGLLYR